MRSYIEFTDYIDLEEVLDYSDTFELFEEYVQERIYESDVIYYSEAIKFLAENDPSSQISLELASDCGYENLSSEVLATVLLQELLQGELPDLEDYWNDNKEEEEDEDL